MSEWKLLVCFIILFSRIKIFKQSLWVFFMQNISIKKKINCPDNLIYYTTLFAFHHLVIKFFLFFLFKGRLMLELLKKRIATFSCVTNASYFVLWRDWQGEAFEVMKIDHLDHKVDIYVLFSMFLGCYGSAYIRIAWNDKSTSCSCVSSGF